MKSETQILDFVVKIMPDIQRDVLCDSLKEVDLKKDDNRPDQAKHCIHQRFPQQDPAGSLDPICADCGIDHGLGQLRHVHVHDRLTYNEQDGDGKKRPRASDIVRIDTSDYPHV